jgi:cell division protein FtsB
MVRWTMAKALLGHLGGPDLRLLADLCRLRRQVRDLEARLATIKQENAAARRPEQDAR